MMTILICAIVFAPFGILIIKKTSINFGFGDYLGGCCGMAVAGAAIGFCIACALPKKYIRVAWCSKIACLADANQTSGRFFLGHGQISGRNIYNYYEQIDSVNFHLWQEDAATSDIQYSKTLPPQVCISFYKPDEDAPMNKFALDLTVEEYGEYKRRATFIIPPGSIQNNFSLDAQ